MTGGLPLRDAQALAVDAERAGFDEAPHGVQRQIDAVGLHVRLLGRGVGQSDGLQTPHLIAG